MVLWVEATISIDLLVAVIARVPRLSTSEGNVGIVLGIPIAVVYSLFARKPGRLTWKRAGIPLMIPIALWFVAIVGLEIASHVA
jgi:hypothetical protein